MERSRFNTRILVVIAILVALAIAIGTAFLPEYASSFDVTKNHRYSFSREGIKFVDGLGEDIKLYVVRAGVQDLALETFFERFCNASSRVGLEFVDSTDTEKLTELNLDGEINGYTIVVKSDKRQAEISYYDQMLTYTNAELGFENMPGSEYSYYLMYYQYYYNSIAGQGGDTTQIEQLIYSLAYNTSVYFRGEALILEACEYVSLEKIPQIFFVGGHGETIDTKSALGLAFGEQKLVDLTDYEKITYNDASCIVINDPKEDLNDAETQKILDYMRGGGRLFVITDSSNLEMKNLTRLLSAYGLSSKGGIVCEGEGEEQSTAITPAINYNHDSMAPLYESGITPQIINSNHITMFTPTDGSLITTALLTSSSTSYTEGSTEKGIQTLGASAEESVGKETARLVWFTGAESFNSAELEASITESNMYLALYAISWLNRAYDSNVPETLPILQDNSIVAVSAGGAIFLGITFILIIPAAVVVWTVTVRYKREKRKQIKGE